MSHHHQALIDKLKEMYPDIDRHRLSLAVDWHPDEDHWIIRLEKGEHALHTHLKAKDAEDCLSGVQCVYLGTQIGQFISNFELLEAGD